MKILSEHSVNNHTEIIQMRLDKMTIFYCMISDISSKACTQNNENIDIQVKGIYTHLKEN